MSCSDRISNVSGSHANGIEGDYTAAIDWGDGSAPSLGTVSGVSGNFSVSGFHVYAEEGSYNISTHVADIGGSTVNAITPVNVADAALSASGTTILAPHGTPLNNAVMATFTDADPNGVVSDYTATIAWGDATSSAGTITANASGGFN